MIPRPGIHLVHKPAFASSASLVEEFVADVRRAGVRPGKLPACHGGALDPFAEGLLLILAGPATRLFELLHPIPKAYEAEIAWGSETDNGDPLGKEVATGDGTQLSAASLEAALREFVGLREQVPPLHSNKRVGGERAYELAWRGEQVELPPVQVYLHSAEWISHDLPKSSRVRLVCRGGYYVRSLARDLGRALGCRAHLRALTRNSIGPWQDPNPGRPELVAGEALLPWCPSRQLSRAEAARTQYGHAIQVGAIAPPDWPLPQGFPDPAAPVRALREGKLLALLSERGGELIPSITLGPGI